MSKSNFQKLKTAFIPLVVLFLALFVTACGDSKQKTSGDMKETQYCERYRKFDEKVSTAAPEEQKELLQNIVAAKDFPTEPSTLADDYALVISGYEKVLNGEDTSTEEETYKEESERISRHAIEHCDVLTGNSGASI